MTAGPPPRLGAAEAEMIVAAMRLIGHPLRLQLLDCLAGGEQPVSALVAQTASPASLVSQQLALLRRGGLVQTRRLAKQVFYALVPERLVQVSQALALLASPPAPPAPPPFGQASPQISAAMFAQVMPRR